MAKKATKSAAPKANAKGKKPAVKNLGAKNAGSVKGGATTELKFNR